MLCSAVAPQITRLVSAPPLGELYFWNSVALSLPESTNFFLKLEHLWWIEILKMSWILQQLPSWDPHGSLHRNHVQIFSRQILGASSLNFSRTWQCSHICHRLTLTVTGLRATPASYGGAFQRHFFPHLAAKAKEESMKFFIRTIWLGLYSSVICLFT